MCDGFPSILLLCGPRWVRSKPYSTAAVSPSGVAVAWCRAASGDYPKNSTECPPMCFTKVPVGDVIRLCGGWKSQELRRLGMLLCVDGIRPSPIPSIGPSRPLVVSGFPPPYRSLQPCLPRTCGGSAALPRRICNGRMHPNISPHAPRTLSLRGWRAKTNWTPKENFSRKLNVRRVIAMSPMREPGLANPPLFER